ncbi:hypothetical protein POM88_008298 [Heracleum sosnowskyi]|uniref:Uncharacterized protein n=1 Tax=Heracleum sosnowskyi TaxID=360622 RepID=A0AAD8J5X6_9APIA|nr:hypothetical protein POM88_008298 [Heracleum sosnowskyi]
MLLKQSPLTRVLLKHNLRFGRKTNRICCSGVVFLHQSSLLFISFPVSSDMSPIYSDTTQDICRLCSKSHGLNVPMQMCLSDNQAIYSHKQQSFIFSKLRRNDGDVKHRVAGNYNHLWITNVVADLQINLCENNQSFGNL